MSRKRKRQFGRLVTVAMALLLAAAALVTALVLTTNQAQALDPTEWEYVRGALDSYIASQYQADSEDGESGFTMESGPWSGGCGVGTTLKDRLDDNNDGVYLGEGDDAACAPILVDVLNGAGGGIIQATSLVTNWNTTTTDTTNTAEIAAKVANHEAAGFSTDITTY